MSRRALIAVTPGEGTEIKLMPGQSLKFHNAPIAEIRINYDPSNMQGVSSTVRIKGVVHPLFKSPVTLDVVDILTFALFSIISFLATTNPSKFTVKF